MKLLIAGGREYHLTNKDMFAIGMFVRRYKITEIVHGNCRGVDQEAGEVGGHLGVEVTPVDAEWEKYRKLGKVKAAGPIRNKKMAEYCKGQYCILFPGGDGTKSMKKLALLNGLTVIEDLIPYLNSNREVF